MMHDREKSDSAIKRDNIGVLYQLGRLRRDT
jgi:hypothetical protein